MSYVTLSDVFNSARFRTGTSTSDFPDTNTALLGLANKHFRRIAVALIENNEDWFATITTASLVSSLNSYSLSTDSSLSGGGNIKVLRAEITYNGTDWQVMTPLNLEQIQSPTALVADVNNMFSTSEPYYALFNNQFMPLPVPTANVSGGLRIFEAVRRKEISGSSLIFGGADDTFTVQLPKEFMEPLEEFLVGDIYERIGKSQEAQGARDQGTLRLEQLRRSFQPRNYDFDLNVGSNAFQDYGE